MRPRPDAAEPLRSVCHRTIAASLAVALLLTGCSTRYVIGQQELKRAKQQFTSQEEVVVRAVRSDENLGDQKVWIRLRADDYLVPPGEGEAFQLADFSNPEYPLNATYHQRNLGPAFFWPGFGILAGTSLLMLVIIGPAFHGERWDLVIPVYGPWIGAMEAFDHAHHGWGDPVLRQVRPRGAGRRGLDQLHADPWARPDHRRGPDSALLNNLRAGSAASFAPPEQNRSRLPPGPESRSVGSSSAG